MRKQLTGSGSRLAVPQDGHTYCARYPIPQRQKKDNGVDQDDVTAGAHRSCPR
jgi:hypothetical protein